MATKNQIKFVQSLHKKKYRQRYGQFIVEGEKSVKEVLNSSWKVQRVFASASWFAEQDLPSDIDKEVSSDTDLQRMAFFKTASPVLAIVHQADEPTYNQETDWVIAVDGVSDPGNLGTIIRIADWYGVKQVVCSMNTVDVYNPKCISATMGSFLRVEVLYDDLSAVLNQAKQPALFAIMEGSDVRQMSPSTGIIVIGSEANGISDALMGCQHEAVTIPRIGSAESLNAAVATGILCERLIP